MKTPERRQWRRFGVFIVNLEHISRVSIVDLEDIFDVFLGTTSYSNLNTLERHSIYKINNWTPEQLY